MSDGPHRSLPLKRGWKHVAERADRDAFDADEISSAIVPALESDCRDESIGELARTIREVVEEQDQRLIKDNVQERIEALRPTAGFEIGQKFIDNVVPISADRVPKLLDLVNAMTAALADRAAKCGRSVEEHFLRNSTAPRARNARERIEQGIAGADLDALARKIMKIEPCGPKRSTLKRDGLDDGVRLP